MNASLIAATLLLLAGGPTHPIQADPIQADTSQADPIQAKTSQAAKSQADTSQAAKSQASTSPKRIDVTQFGVQPGSRKNAVPGVQKALLAAARHKNAVLVFPKGRYDFWPQHCVEREYYMSNSYDVNPKRCAIVLDMLSGLTIDGSGSEFVFHDRMTPFVVDRCSDITIKNLSIDWDIPLTAQSEVIAVAPDHIDLEINERESPFVIEKGKLKFVGEGWKSGWFGTIEFDAKTRRIPAGSGDRCLGGGWNQYRAERLDAERLDGGRVRLHHAFKRLPKVGNYLVMRHSSRDHAGIFVLHSRRTLLQNIDMFHCAGLGVLAQFAWDITMDKCHVRPNPAKGRYLSGHDDGAQISNCRGLVKIQDCIFGGLMDDPINVHGTSVKILKKLDDKRLLCRFMHGMSVGMHWGRPGDEVGYIENRSMATVGKACVASWKAIDKRDFEVVMTEPIPAAIQAGHALENLTWSPDVLIKGCTFDDCRARGLLVTTPGSIRIEKNVFRSSGSAILISGDANGWYESGAVHDVLIQNNRFENCLNSMYQFCHGVISIDPVIPAADPERPFHRNIRIQGNTFLLSDYPVLYARSVDGLTFKDNTLIRNEAFAPWHPRKTMLTFDACRQVVVSGTLMQGEVLGRNLRIRNMTPKDIAVEQGQGITR